MRLLVAEDNVLLGQGIEAGLKQAGFTVDRVLDGASAALALDAVDYELLVLDLGLPRLTGLDLLKGLRNKRSDKGRDIPVIILTARDTVQDRIAGLNAGADDYLVKPFDLAELIARIRALLRRAHGRTTAIIEYPNLQLDPATLQVLQEGKIIQLSARECAILVDLLEHKGTALSRSRLEESLYGWNEEVESNAIEVHIHNLRKKLGDQLIKTIRGVGYLIRKDAT
ncbi:MAG: response regulator transcription factor [Undibacterium sp.]|nr:response regulator transcription factor [Undibacterium sp.]